VTRDLRRCGVTLCDAYTYQVVVIVVVEAEREMVSSALGIVLKVK